MQANQDKKRFEQELNLLRTSKIVGYEPDLSKRPLEAKSLRVEMELAAEKENRTFKLTPDFGKEKVFSSKLLSSLSFKKENVKADIPKYITPFNRNHDFFEDQNDDLMQPEHRQRIIYFD